ncbi:MAG: hypothetical protein IJU81_08640 [Bacteroidales bacterium]|nr:hypothetical protein [Bacteroidales bacterium]
MAIVTVALFAACNKDSAHVNMKFTATAESAKDSGKISLAGHTVRWSDDDTISIYDASLNHAIYYVSDGVGTSRCEFAYHSGSRLGSGPYKAVCPSSIHTNATQVTLPAVQRTVDGSLTTLPMYAVSSNDGLMFYNLCGVLRFRLSASASVALSTIAVTTTGTNIHGTATIAGQGTALTLSALSGGDVAMLACDEPQSLASPKDFYMYLPAGTYSAFRVLLTAADGSVCSKNATGNIVVERGKITTIALSSLSFDAHRFSVSRTKTVVFAPGNLQYIGSAATPYWKFADRHYDYFGTTTGQNSSRTDVDRDLFGWGTSGWNNGNYWYMPYNTSDSTKTPYSNSVGNGYGPKNGSSYYCNLTGSYANADWGVFNAIRNGGDASYHWRTPTHDEWSYLFKTRSASTLNGTANARFALATVNGIGGVIIFPDSYVHPVGIALPVNINNASASWLSNTYSDADWTAMDNCGAVFLPASGYRKGTTVRLVGSDGNAWSSTYSSVVGAYNVYFGSDSLTTDNKGSRYMGRSVRLVRD